MPFVSGHPRDGNILGLDPATKTGWAHSLGFSGLWDLSVKRDESSGMRLVRFRSKIDELHSRLGFGLVAYELAIAISGRRAGSSVQKEIQGVLKLWCTDQGVDFRAYSPSEIKKHATGKGNASKLQMMTAAERKWKRPIEDDNIADALWILDLASVEYGSTTEGDLGLT